MRICSIVNKAHSTFKGIHEAQTTSHNSMFFPIIIYHNCFFIDIPSVPWAPGSKLPWSIKVLGLDACLTWISALLLTSCGSLSKLLHLFMPVSLPKMQVILAMGEECWKGPKSISKKLRGKYRTKDILKTWIYYLSIIPVAKYRTDQILNPCFLNEEMSKQ